MVHKRKIVYKRIPKNWEPYDSARNYKQALYLKQGTPEFMEPKIVKVGKKGDVFPYIIAVKKGMW